MCGICGIVDFNQTFSDTRKQSVAKMNDVLVHRGPDESGAYHDELCSLAMRRLSIIDLSQGQQPQFNESESICVFQNGEIYNYRELKNDLVQKGFHFKTNSDTEVLAHLYEAHGEAMFHRLKGMFAICIYDRTKKIFLFARDRFGEKPFYYHYKNKVFSYSSEVKSLLTNKIIDRRLDLNALFYYLRTSLVPEPQTLLENVKILQPGHYIKLDEKGIKIKKYYHLTYKVNESIRSDEEAVAFIEPHLIRAIQRQTVSDVPIGAFLSGGIDSSSVVALLQKNAVRPVKTFNVRFEDQAYDESPIARKVAAFCKTDHHEIVVPNYDFEESVFWTIMDHIGLPFRDSSAIPTYFISKAIGKEVKVALSGDGGDELFGGYALFQWYQKILTAKKIYRPFRVAAGHGLSWSQSIPGLNQVSKVRQLERAIRTSLQGEADIPVSLNEMFVEEEIAGLFASDAEILKNVNHFNYPLLKEYPSESATWSPLRKIMYYRSRHTLSGNMLVKVDRMSMANSLEVRAPFLDPDLFDAAAQLPDRFLIHNGKGKWILRKIMEKHLPPEVFNHPKTGFSIPLYKYRNDAFRNLARQLLYDENPCPGLWSNAQLAKIFNEGLTHDKNNAHMSVFKSAHRLWMFMQLFGWMKRFEIKV